MVKGKKHTTNIKTRAYLGFMRSEQFGKPSLVSDMVELYRYLIDNLIIEFSQALTPKSFKVKTEWFSANL
jgi:CRISPR/Cas system-associated endonuclease Cas1